MDTTTLTPYLLQALGGAVGGNILGAITRGGGGLVGRTVFGAIGGVAAGYGATQLDAIQNVTQLWSNLIEGENGVRLSQLLTGAAGGGVLGFITGLLIRSRA